MDKLVNYLDIEFSNRREKCVLIIEPKIPYSVEDQTFHKTPDAIIIKDNVICIIDLKGYYDEITADCRLGEAWKTSEGEIIQLTIKKNPYIQAKEYHDLFLDYLNENILTEKFRKNGKKWSVSNLYSWIVTGELSTVEVIGTDRRRDRFFKIIPVEKVSEQLAFLSSKYKQTARNTDKIISSLGATRVTLEDWYRLDSNGSGIRPSGLIRKISQLMESKDGQTQFKALKYIQELELRQHRTHIVRCIERSPYKEIRRDALTTLINWQDTGLDSIFSTTLRDSSQEIVNFSLEYLAKDGYPDTYNVLSEMLKTHPDPMIPKILKAITSSGHKDSGKTIFEYARNNFFDKPFEKFQNIHQIYEKTRKREESREKWKEYRELSQERGRIRHLIETTIDCLGEIQHQESENWLTDIITRPTTLGYETDDYTQLDETTNFMYVFRSACTALGQIGSDNADTASYLMDKLPTLPEYFQYCILDLLGNLGVKQAVPILKQYLEDQENIAYNDTVKALEKIGSEEAFNALAKAYTRNPDSYEGMNTGQALYSIDEEGFVDLILEQLQSKKVKTRYKEVYMQAIRGSVSLRCADTLFDLLKHKKLSENAAWSLSYLTDCKEIFDQLMELTWSDNSIERSGALEALDKHFINNPDELERFETENASKRTRRTIAYYYSKSDSKHRLFKYAKDPDKDVRETVFRYISNKRYSGEFIVGSDSRRKTTSRVAIEEEYLGLNMKKEVVLIPKRNIVEVAVSTFEEYYHGLYLKIEDTDGSFENMMLVPRYKPSWFSQETIKELYSEIKPGQKENDIDNPIITKLWKSLRRSLPKKTQQLW